MYLRQGTFSHLPELSDPEIGAQVRYALLNNWPVSIEYTDDPHPRNVYWEMWGLPMFDLHEPDGVLTELAACRDALPRHYIRVAAYDARYGRQTTALSFLVQRPAVEPGFSLARTESGDRRQQYGWRSYAADQPPGERYGGLGAAR